MTESEFISYWDREYPEALPINHELKWKYKDRWFRIHSLPSSKRYAENEDEYAIILHRQNQLINDLIGEKTEMFISIGLYEYGSLNDNCSGVEGFDKFQKVFSVNLKKERPEEYEDEVNLEIYVTVEKWEKHSHDKTLRAIADDKFRAMFVCPSKQCIIAPYDGGVDIVVDTAQKRNELKLKYKDWLSDREDGL